MFKRSLLILSILGLLPAFAGDVESALAKGENVFLYLYTPSCGHCIRFEPKYNKISKMYDGDYKFIKVDASTSYGYSLMSQYGGRFVPYVLLLNKKKNQVWQLTPSCIMDTVCIEKNLKEFKK